MKRNQDKLLEELKSNQLSKKSMNKITGGSVNWDSNFIIHTESGYLVHTINSEGISTLMLTKSLESRTYTTHFPCGLDASDRKIISIIDN